ncbi:hypothetical protein NMY22_g17820 [Coprinellus aureogranulatus]|nr:hypothetical protein NMY22_g17820 [Coprinellus aureogranulatus]
MHSGKAKPKTKKPKQEKKIPIQSILPTIQTLLPTLLLLRIPPTHNKRTLKLGPQRIRPQPIRTVAYLQFDYWIDEYDDAAPHTIFECLPPVTKFGLYLSMQEGVFFCEEECDEAELNLPRAFLEGLKEFTYPCNWTLRHTAGPLAHYINLEKLVLDFGGHPSDFIDSLDPDTPSSNRLSIGHQGVRRLGREHRVHSPPQLYLWNSASVLLEWVLDSSEEHHPFGCSNAPPPEVDVASMRSSVESHRSDSNYPKGSFGQTSYFPGASTFRPVGRTASSSLWLRSARKGR